MQAKSKFREAGVDLPPKSKWLDPRKEALLGWLAKPERSWDADGHCDEEFAIDFLDIDHYLQVTKPSLLL